MNSPGIDKFYHKFELAISAILGYYKIWPGELQSSLFLSFSVTSPGCYFCLYCIISQMDQKRVHLPV